MRFALAVLASLALFGAVPSTETVQTAAEVVIRGIGIVDVAAGRMAEGQDIVVRGTRIERIAPAGGPLPPAKTTIEGSGKVAIPGLIAVGVRLAAFSPAAMQGLLAQGVTAVQDTGTDTLRLTRWREDLNSGRLYAPRITSPCAPPRAPLADLGPTVTAEAPEAVHAELARLVTNGGRRPIEALRSVTIDRARALCLDGLGAIAAGAPADLVVIDANPLDDITRTRAIDAVIFRGEVMTRAHLNMLARGTLPLPTPAR